MPGGLLLIFLSLCENETNVASLHQEKESREKINFFIFYLKGM
jgi:hypothetical protein